MKVTTRLLGPTGVSEQQTKTINQGEEVVLEADATVMDDGSEINHPVSAHRIMSEKEAEEKEKSSEQQENQPLRYFQKGFVSPHGWKKGQSGNPGGRPRSGRSLTDQLQNFISRQSITLADGTVLTGKDVVAYCLVQSAMRGDVQAQKYIYDRIDGTPVATVRDITERDPANAQIQVTFVPPSGKQELA